MGKSHSHGNQKGNSASHPSALPFPTHALRQSFLFLFFLHRHRKRELLQDGLFGLPKRRSEEAELSRVQRAGLRQEQAGRELAPSGSNSDQGERERGGGG